MRRRPADHDLGPHAADQTGDAAVTQATADKERQHQHGPKTEKGKA